MRFATIKTMLSVNALKYTIEHLLKVAFPTEKPLPYQLNVSENELAVVVAEAFTISSHLLSDDEVMQLRNGGGSAELVCVSAMDVEVPFFKSRRTSFAYVGFEAGSNKLLVPYDIVTLPFLLLSKSDEGDDSPRDQHGRFQFANSLANVYGFVDVPLVDAYALQLRQWVLQHIDVPFCWAPRVPKVVPTHDIDLTCRFHSSWQAFKSIFGRDLILEHSLRNATGSFREFRNWKKCSDDDPYLLAISELEKQALDNDKNAVFFFKAQQLCEYDATYDISDPRVGRVIRQLLDADMTVGLHGSYGSLDDEKTLCNEKKRLESVVSASVTCGRQHYLRFNPERSQTIRAWRKAGIEHDYTLGYAERPGFRCGTCHPYPLYDLDDDSPTSVIEHPLIVMDGTLIDHMKLDVDASAAAIRELMQRCAGAEGDFVFLWHNHTTSRGFRPYYVRCMKTVFK